MKLFTKDNKGTSSIKSGSDRNVCTSCLIKIKDVLFVFKYCSDNCLIHFGPDPQILDLAENVLSIEIVHLV
jgi:hypothetical protein